MFALRRVVWCMSVCMIGISPTIAFAQSGTRGGATPPSRQQIERDPSAGSASRQTDAAVAMRGYCPVCLVEMKQWIKGDPRFAVVFDGKKYYFPGREQVEMFQKSPESYVPALNGEDIVHYKHTGERIAGKLEHGVIHEGRVYVFASADNLQSFKANPQQYADADIALGGECVVCRKDMNQRVAGKPEFTAVHQGLRLFFPGEEQKAMFMASPDQYTADLPKPTPQGSQTSGPSASGPTQGSERSTPANSGSGAR
jgi:YHS domain-containing protein